jgi:hypothetical protein
MKRYLKVWFHCRLRFNLVEGGLSLKPPSTRSKELSRVPKRRKIFCCKILGRKPWFVSGSGSQFREQRKFGSGFSILDLILLSFFALTVRC